MSSLRELLERWEAWSRTADTTDNGWENDFPEWSQLVQTTLEFMRQKSPAHANAAEREDVESVWHLTSEDFTSFSNLLRIPRDSRTGF